MAGRTGGTGRRVEVAPERLAGWLERFRARHGDLVHDAEAGAEVDSVVIRAADGARALLSPPFPPLVVVDAPDAGVGAHALRSRVVGVLLVRLGGHAAGVFDGDRWLATKVGSRPVHGRSAAGGWSQQRFARRREGQVKVALAAAADVAAAVLLPAVPQLDAVVVGGDRRSVDTVLADRRLAPLRHLIVAPLLDVPDPRRTVLESAPARYRAVRVTITDPPVPG